MKRPQLIIIAVVVFIALVAFVSSAFIVNETEQVIITQFGKPVGDGIVTPGIHFKMPIIQTLHFFDKRFLEWDIIKAPKSTRLADRLLNPLLGKSYVVYSTKKVNDKVGATS